MYDDAHTYRQVNPIPAAHVIVTFAHTSIPICCCDNTATYPLRAASVSGAGSVDTQELKRHPSTHVP